MPILINPLEINKHNKEVAELLRDNLLDDIQKGITCWRDGKVFLIPESSQHPKIELILTHTLILRSRNHKVDGELKEGYRLEIIDANKSFLARGAYGVIQQILGTLTLTNSEITLKRNKPRLLKLYQAHAKQSINDTTYQVKHLHAKRVIKLTPSLNDHTFGLVMRHLDGVTLHKVIGQDKEKHSLTLIQRYRLSLAILEAYQSQMTVNGILHRDIKPENILIDKLDSKHPVVSFVDFDNKIAIPTKSTGSAATISTDIREKLANYGNIGKTIIQQLERLEHGAKSHNPYWMNSSKKIRSIIQALENLPQNTTEAQLQTFSHDPGSALFKALNKHRLTPLTFLGQLAWNRAKTLQKVHAVPKVIERNPALFSPLEPSFSPLFPMYQPSEKFSAFLENISPPENEVFVPIVGTYGYIPPEGFSEQPHLTPNYDHFALAQVISLLWEIPAKTFNQQDYMKAKNLADSMSYLGKIPVELIPNPEERSKLESMLTSLAEQIPEERASISTAIAFFRDLQPQEHYLPAVSKM